MTDTTTDDDEAVSQGNPTTVATTPVTGAIPSGIPGSLAPATGAFGANLPLLGLGIGLLSGGNQHNFAHALANGLIGMQQGDQYSRQKALDQLNFAYAPATARFAYNQGLANDAYTKLQLAARGFDATTGLPRTQQSVPGQLAPPMQQQSAPPIQPQMQSAPAVPQGGGIIPAVSDASLSMTPPAGFVPQSSAGNAPPQTQPQIQQALQQQINPAGGGNAPSMPPVQQMPPAQSQMPQQPQQLAAQGNGGLPSNMPLADQYASLASNASFDPNNPASMQKYESFVGLDPKNAGNVAKMRQADVAQFKAGYAVDQNTGRYIPAPGAADVAQTQAFANKAPEFALQSQENQYKLGQISAEGDQARMTQRNMANINTAGLAGAGPAQVVGADNNGYLHTDGGSVIPPSSKAPPLPASPEYLSAATPGALKTSQEMTDAISPAQQALQRLNVVQQALQQTQSGAWMTDKAGFLAGLKSAGIPLPPGQDANLTNVQTVLHQTVVDTLNTLKATQPRFAQAEFKLLQSNSENPNLQPGANLEMLANDKGVLQRNIQMAQDWQTAQSPQGGGWSPIQPQAFQTAWNSAPQNALSNFVDSQKQSIGPLKGMPGNNGSPAPTNYVRVNGKLVPQ